MSDQESPNKGSLSSVQKCFNFLVEQILRGKMKPNEVVSETLTTSEVTKLGIKISQAKVKEAINRLVDYGLCVRDEKLKPRVIHHDFERCKTLLCGRVAAETLVLSRICSGNEPSKLEQVEVIHGEMSSMLDSEFDPLRFVELDLRLHEVLAEQSGSVAAIPMIRRSFFALVLGIPGVLPDKAVAAQTVQQHSEFLEALSTNDQPLALKRLMSHLAYSSKRHHETIRTFMEIELSSLFEQLTACLPSQNP